MTIDLHTHTRYSDGTDDIDSWIAGVVAAGLTAVAITDHDTTAGWAAAAAARPEHVTLVRGAELSTHVVVGERRCSIHLLAYLFDPAEPTLAAEMRRLRVDRAERGMRMVQRMVDDGVPISAQQVLNIAQGAPIGRPHIGRALLAVGLVDSVNEAFGTYLSGRGPYYVAKGDTPLEAAISLVRGAGGVPVLAHARARGAASVTDEAFIARYAADGLAGIEVDHPDHSAADRAALRALAVDHHLIATGSSDYHGRNKSLTLGQERTTDEALARIVAASSGVIGLLGPGTSSNGGSHDDVH